MPLFIIIIFVDFFFLCLSYLFIIYVQLQQTNLFFYF